MAWRSAPDATGMDEGVRPLPHFSQQRQGSTRLSADFARASFGGNDAAVAWLDEWLRHAGIMDCRE